MTMKNDNNIKVAIQGLQGSNHHVAAIRHFGENASVIECENFDRVFDELCEGRATHAMVAIENTVAGTILPNYALLRESSAQIVGEVYLRIEHCLMTNKGIRIDQLNEVHSHPMAILQCKKFFRNHPNIKLIEVEDTAGAAKEIALSDAKNAGAIAPAPAANLYDLEILARGIETDKKNFTRFLVLVCDKQTTIPADADKASISFNVIHEKGSLARILNIMSEEDINLSKIQSLPLVGREWEYYIHVDMEFRSQEQYHRAMKRVKPLLNELHILGVYKKGNKDVTITENELNKSEIL